MKQRGTISEYVHEFEDLSSQVNNLDDENLECIFMNGLKPEIHDLVLFLKPIGLDAVIEAAVRVEARVLCIMVEGNISQSNRNAKSYTAAQAWGNSHYNSWKVRSITGDITSQSAAGKSGSSDSSINKSSAHTGYSGQKGRRKLSDAEF